MQENQLDKLEVQSNSNSFQKCSSDLERELMGSLLTGNPITGGRYESLFSQNQSGPSADGDSNSLCFIPRNNNVAHHNSYYDDQNFQNLRFYPHLHNQPLTPPESPSASIDGFGHFQPNYGARLDPTQTVGVYGHLQNIHQENIHQGGKDYGKMWLVMLIGNIPKDIDGNSRIQNVLKAKLQNKYEEFKRWLAEICKQNRYSASIADFIDDYLIANPEGDHYALFKNIFRQYFVDFIKHRCQRFYKRRDNGPLLDIATILTRNRQFLSLLHSKVIAATQNGKYSQYISQN